MMYFVQGRLFKRKLKFGGTTFGSRQMFITFIFFLCTFVNTTGINQKNTGDSTKIETTNTELKNSENCTLIDDLLDSEFVDIIDETKFSEPDPKKSQSNSAIDHGKNRHKLRNEPVLPEDFKESAKEDYINRLINSLNTISRHVNKSIAESQTKPQIPTLDIFRLINQSNVKNVTIQDFINMTAVSPLAALVESTRTQEKKTTPAHTSPSALLNSPLNNTKNTISKSQENVTTNNTEYEEKDWLKIDVATPKIQIKDVFKHNITKANGPEKHSQVNVSEEKTKNNVTIWKYELSDFQKDTMSLWNSLGQNSQKKNVTEDKDLLNNDFTSLQSKENNLTNTIQLKNIIQSDYDIELKSLVNQKLFYNRNVVSQKPVTVTNSKTTTEKMLEGNITELFLNLLKTMRKNNNSISDTELLNNISNIATKKLPEFKNISAIIVTYCDVKNISIKEENEKKFISNKKQAKPVEYFNDDYSEETYDIIHKSPLLLNVDYDAGLSYVGNLTQSERTELLEAANYGIERMKDLYGVQEPKLYHMGYWLDHNNPARYVAAFNAPMEEASEYAKYGYASLQAATKLQELLRNQDNAESREDISNFHAPALKNSALHDSCPLRGVPKCPPASKRYRTHDGTCNNPSHPRWGSAMTPVQRFIPPIYSDGLQAARRATDGSKLPSAREISASIHEDHDVETLGITHLLMQWGQFMDHDITASSQSRGFNGSVPQCCDGDGGFVQGEFLHPECMPIAVPANDRFYGQFGVRCLEFVRSSPAPREQCALGWREQINQVTAYLDASPVYGNSAKQSDKLRLFRNGMLQYGRVQHRRPLLPTGAEELCRRGAAAADCFRAGDNRANEHPGLVSIHIVWLRRHNRIATELAHLNPHWSDEKIYQEARKIVGAMIQHITYREFLPIVLGFEVMSVFELSPLTRGWYEGYSTDTNAGIANSFGAAAFRFGHSLVQASFVRYDADHNPIRNNVSLHDESSNPSNIWSSGAVDRLLLGMVNQPIRKRDEFITEELTNHLFQTPSFPFGMDLAAINVQRGRDHGIPPYTMWREPCGLSPILEWDDLHRIMPSRVVRKLQDLYRHVDDVDLFTGGVSERPVVGGLVGPTFACIIAQQAANTRKGDRFWYENGQFESSFTPAQLQQLRKVTLAQILCQTLDSIQTVQPFVFMAADDQKNQRISCESSFINSFDLTPWIEMGSNLDNNIPDFDHNEKLKNAPNRPVTKKPFQKNDSTDFTKFRNTTTKKNPKTTTSRPTSAGTKTFPKSAGRPTPQIDLPINTDIDILPNPLNVTATLNTSTDKLTNGLDDKLDFKNKTRRFENSEEIDKEQLRNTIHEYMIFQANKRPNPNPIESYRSHQQNLKNYPNRPQTVVKPPISVTENVNSFTYLINIVPKTTPRYSSNKNVVKITYQSDDIYKRPQPIFINNKHTIPVYQNNKIVQKPTELDESYFLRTQTDKQNHSFNTDPPALRSGENSTSDILPYPKTEALTQDSTESTTLSDIYKLVTFSHVGTFTRDTTEKNPIRKFDDRPNKFHYTTKRPEIINAFVNNSPALKLLTENKTDFIYNSVPMKQTTKRVTPRHDTPLTNDFKLTTDTGILPQTQALKQKLTKNDVQITTSQPKITTYHYTNKRPTIATYESAITTLKTVTQLTEHSNDASDYTDNTSTTKPPRYYYLGNVLHKYSDDKDSQTKRHGLIPNKIDTSDTTSTKTDHEQNAPVKKSNDEFDTKNTQQIEQTRQNRPKRPAMTSTDSTRRFNKPTRTKAQATKDSKPQVAFDVIPSENSPHLWAIYDEKTEIQDSLDRIAMPPIKSDPYALNELPRPMNLTALHKPRRKKPART